ncbi:MAG TPA: hypothetical protein VHF46_06435, partial [Rubrobacteraceae bacterium]|nr:hypothetical protein [Rubrobacteraceae bacterium]
MRETAKRIFDVRAFRRPLSVAALILMDAVALTLGILVSVYLVGEEGQTGEVARSSLPIMLAVGLALFAAHDLYDRASRRRNPGALIGAVMWWAGLLVIGSVFYPDTALAPGSVLLAASVALVVGGSLRLLYEQV